MAEKKKFRVTWEIIVEVEAEDPDDATSLADEKWCNGENEMHCYIEEIE